MFGEFGSAIASAAGDAFGTAFDKSMDYAFGSWAADDALDRSRAMGNFNAELQRKQSTWNAQNMPSLMKEGLLNAGYNPLLAVNSAGVPSASASAGAGPMASGSGGHTKTDILGNLQQIANIKQTNAQADYLDKKTENEGWRVLTLDTRQAAGLGAKVCKVLGINLNESGNRQWIVAYNTVTGELRNVGDATIFGMTNKTPEVSNAKDVPSFNVQGENIKLLGPGFFYPSPYPFGR